MPATTATWGLTYPLGTDRLCDGPTYIEQLADEVDILLGRYNDILDRIQIPPYASLRATIPQLYPAAVNPAGFPTLDVAYDTVNADTGNYTNLPAQPDTITVDTTPGVSNQIPEGIYLWGQYSWMEQPNAAVNTGYYNQTMITVQPFNNPGGGAIEDNVGATLMGQTWFAPRRQTISNGKLVFYSQVGNRNAILGTFTTLQEGAFFMLWIGDDS